MYLSHMWSGLGKVLQQVRQAVSKAMMVLQRDDLGTPRNCLGPAVGRFMSVPVLHVVEAHGLLHDPQDLGRKI